MYTTLTWSSFAVRQFSLGILIAVIVMNSIKAGCMFWTLRRHREPTLITFGDALASFLDQPDRCSEGRCLLSKSDLARASSPWKSSSVSARNKPSPRPYETLFRRRWFSAASQKRWILTICLCALALIIGSLLLSHASSKVTLYTGRQTVFGLGKVVSKQFLTVPVTISPMSNTSITGFGTVDPRAIIHTNLPSEGSAGLTASVLLSNLPQLVRLGSLWQI